MRRGTRALALLALFAAACGGSPPRPPQARPPAVEGGAIYERLRPSFVVLRCLGERWGTGFGFGRPGRVATAAHVAQCPRELTAELMDGTRVGVRVVAMGAATDIALLELIGPRAGEIVPIPLRQELLPVGGRVVSVGFPVGPEEDGPHDFTVTEGILAQRTEDRLIHDAAISPGSSGGPVLDEEGNLIGLNYATPRNSSVAIAVPIEDVLELHRETPANAGDPRDPFEIGVELGLDYAAADSYPFHFVGAELSGWASAFDQIVGTFRAIITGRIPHLLESSGTWLEGFRWAVEIDFAYRLRIDGFPLVFELGAGFSLGFDRLNLVRQELMLADPMCDPALERCEVLTFTTRMPREDFLPRPLLTLRVVRLGPISVGYTVLFDVDNVIETEHRFMVRARFL